MNMQNSRADPKLTRVHGTYINSSWRLKMTINLVKKFIAVLLFSAAIVLSGCASIPKESVDLSAGIGNGIAESKRSHMNLLNVYFAAKRTELDRVIENEYLPSFVAKVQAGLIKAGLPATLTPTQQADVIKMVLKEQDERQGDLEKTRLYLYEYLDEHYTTLMRANAGVTALLQSAVNVKESTSQISGTLSSASGGKVDLNQLEEKFNEYLKDAGTDTGKAL